MKTVVWIIVAIIVIGGGIWLYESSQNGSMNMTDTSTTTVDNGAASPAPTSDNTASTTPAAPQTVTVSYNGSAFSPATVTLHAGDTVTFKDTTSKNMWIASDPHPTHTDYDGTSRTTHCAAGYTGATPFDECAGKTTDYSFTFTKTGTFGYHDHLNPSAHGSVTVQ